MSDHIKQQEVQEFFAKKVSFSWKTTELDSFVLSEWGNSKHMENMLLHLSLSSSAHSFKLLHNGCTEKPRESPKLLTKVRILAKEVN